MCSNNIKYSIKKGKKMTSKTINLGQTNAVNLCLMRDEERLYYVQVSAWHRSDDTPDGLHQCQEINFDDNRSLAESFIKDFSEESANEFYDDFNC